MKFIKSLILSLFFIILLPSTIFARDLVREENGERCIDLEAAYADINDSSKALTGQDNSVDAVKRVNTIASLANIMSILINFIITYFSIIEKIEICLLNIFHIIYYVN